MTSRAIRSAEGEDISRAVKGLRARLSSQQDQLCLKEQREGKSGGGGGDGGVGRGLFLVVEGHKWEE